MVEHSGHWNTSEEAAAAAVEGADSEPAAVALEVSAESGASDRCRFVLVSSVEDDAVFVAAADAVDFRFVAAALLFGSDCAAEAAAAAAVGCDRISGISSSSDGDARRTDRGCCAEEAEAPVAGARAGALISGRIGTAVDDAAAAA